MSQEEFCSMELVTIALKTMFRIPIAVLGDSKFANIIMQQRVAGF